MPDTLEIQMAEHDRQRRLERLQRAKKVAMNSSPLINVVRIVPGGHVLRYADMGSPQSRAKPPGVSELQVFVAITDQHDAPVSEAKYHGKFTKNPAVVQFRPEDDGKVATHYARWVSPTGQNGPWSLPVSVRIAA